MISLDECPCSGRTLDKLLAPTVLAQLAAENLHGYEITQRLANSPLLGVRPPPRKCGSLAGLKMRGS